MPLYSTARGGAETTYFFIDAGSLRGYLNNISRRFFDGLEFEIDYAAVREGYTKAFLYDAVPVQRHGEDPAVYDARVADIHRKLGEASRVDGLHVYTGDARYRRNRGNEQKKVDILIAVDMLTHTFRGNMSRAVLLTGDLDFKPLLDALVREGMFTRLIYPPGETTEELINAADAQSPLNLYTLRNWLKPASRAMFELPETDTNHTSVSLIGLELGRWHDEEGRLVRVLKEPDGFVVARDNDGARRFEVRGTKFSLLRHFCGELGIAFENGIEA